MPSLRVAIVGATGYSGEELVRLLVRHPKVEITALVSRQHAGKPLGEVVPHVPSGIGERLLERLLPGELADRAEAVFLALPPGSSAAFAGELYRRGCVVFDLGPDFRLRNAKLYKEFYGWDHPAEDLLADALYALPEWYRGKIPSARLFALPGCYPTGILLSLLPLLERNLIARGSVVVFALSGVTGAGRKPEPRLLFAELADNAYAYGLPRHRHLAEIEQELDSWSPGGVGPLCFIPHLIPVRRGILLTITFRLARASVTDQELWDAYQVRYHGEPFLRVLPPGSGRAPNIRDVAGSNLIELLAGSDPLRGTGWVLAALDNLGKGAAGQAVQAMNLRFGWEEPLGLDPYPGGPI
jgi:N-acetyl-gamma-glutamyl-phosphate reductase